MTQKLLAKYQRNIDSVITGLQEFKTKFDKDPAHAFSWGDGAFKAAAELNVLKDVVSLLQDGHSAQSVRDYLLDSVLHGSKYPAHSTSPTSNLIEQYTLAARAAILSDLRNYE